MSILIRGAHNLRPEHRPSVVTIGSFDGVHRGHQLLLEQLQQAAAERGLPGVVVIFEPQPREFFTPQAAAPRLQTMGEKVLSLKAYGAEKICCLNFDEQLSQLNAQAFVQSILVDGLGVKHLIIGDDFRFGCNREGDQNMLRAEGERHGFSMSSADTVEHRGERISSTRIRQALADGDFTLARELLGRPFSMTGRVVRGKQLGRQLGFPTANVLMKRIVSPLRGVFVVEVTLRQSGQRYRGVANIGFRPTVERDGREPVLETYLFDFSGDLYGQKIEVTFQRKLRDERQFSSVEELRQQIQNDIADAQNM